MPYPSAFGSLDWSEAPWIFQPVGEVFNTPRNYNAAKEIPCADGHHICGNPADFAQGCIRDTSLPPVEYDEQGLPLCCEGCIVWEGGVVISGEWVEDVSLDYRWEGGVVIGGEWGSSVPPPGVDCTSASPIVVGVPNHQIVTPGTDCWFYWTADGVHNYRLTFTGIHPEEIVASLWSGVCPGGLLPIPNLYDPDTYTYSWLVPPAGTVWLKISTGADTAVVDFTLISYP